MSLYPFQGLGPVSMRRFFMGLMLVLPNLAFSSTGAAGPEWLQSPGDWAQERVLYQKAAAELDSGAGNRYLEMRDALDSYPLSVDLDFAVRLGQLHDMTAQQARLFMRSASGTPLASRFWLPICGTKRKTAGGERFWTCSTKCPRCQSFSVTTTKRN